MAADRFWQTLPLEIEATKADPRIADLTPAGRAAFVWLLAEQWIAEDGYLPADEEFLRQAAAVGEAWPGVKRAVLVLFDVVEKGLAYPPVREEWERRLAAHLAMSEGGKRGRALQLGAGEAQGGAVAPETEESLYVVRESKGSLKRAYNGQSQKGEHRTDQIAETANRGSEDQDGAEPKAEGQAGTEAAGISPRNALQKQVVSHHAHEDVRQRFTGVDSAAMSIIAPTPEMMQRRPGEGGLPVRLDSGAKDENHGAEVRPSAQQEHLGHPGASVGGDFEGLDLSEPIQPSPEPERRGRRVRRPW